MLKKVIYGCDWPGCETESPLIEPNGGAIMMIGWKVLIDPPPLALRHTLCPEHRYKTSEELWAADDDPPETLTGTERRE